MIRIVLVEDHELQLAGLRFILDSQSGIQVVGSFTSAELFLQQESLLQYDILLADIHMPGMDGIELTNYILKENPLRKIALLTMQRGTRYWQKAEKAGVKGYILKNAPIEQLMDAIQCINKGQIYLDPAVASFTQEDDIHLKSTLTITESPNTLLSDREKEILVLVCEEYSSAQIAEKLFISTGTVDTHRKNILIKLGVNNTVGLVKYALKHGLLNKQ